MSQIGNGDGGLEMIGRLLGNVDGKAGRVATKLGGGASQEFARLMASAQGRLNGGQASPVSADTGGKGMPALPDQLRSALSALGEEVARLRQRLASDAPGQLAGGSAGDRGLQGMLDQMVDTLSASDGRQSAANGAGTGGASMAVERPGESTAGLEPLTRNGQALAAASAGGRPLESPRPEIPGDLPASGDAAPQSRLMERLAADDTFAVEVAGLAQALADWREALDAGVPAQTEMAANALHDRLAALRESMQDGMAGAADQPPGLIGQMQALQQLMGRAESARPAEASAARGAGEPRAWSEWSWRLAGGGQSSSSRSGTAAGPGAAAPSGPGGDNPDWSGGPVTAALGLVGREMPTPLRNERLTSPHWAASGGPGGWSAETAVETMMPSGGLGQATGAASSSLTSGQSAGGIFTGQAATPPPNPQMPAQLGQQIQWMAGKGVSRANIELRPADLGPLKISIETQGDETRIALTATNATTQGLLEQQLPRLKEWLQESGLAHSEVDVSLGEEGDFGQQLADADGEESDGGGGLPGDAEAMTSAGVSADGEGSAEWVEGQGVLDLFA